MNRLHELWFGYFYPSIKGNEPAGVLDFLLIGGALTWLGKRIAQEWRQHKAHVHAKLDHLIVNSDVPNEVDGIPDHLQPRAGEGM